MAGLRIDILTLFPEALTGALGCSILSRAAKAGAAGYHLHNVRDWTHDKHRTVDDRPFGGGPGMVMMCQPLHDAIVAVEAMDDRPASRILLSPQGVPLDQACVESLAKHPRLLLIAGHYEGIDERVIEAMQLREISVGDYVLSGGEIPALLLVDAVVRLLPGVLGHEDSAAEDSFAARGPAGERLLEGPQYTRPRDWDGRFVPDVLVSGDHKAVREWRMRMMLDRTRRRRPDLLGPDADL
ncbi:MAG: tRNA (guanosine(37)-N1)-methyltransferase TrmD [Phycisphaerales bacterium]|nr:MAG: tRNA (guanosine(37)-N1)-methyltransferase TrmD [Planctomycetota bacterium]